MRTLAMRDGPMRASEPRRAAAKAPATAWPHDRPAKKMRMWRDIQPADWRSRMQRMHCLNRRILQPPDVAVNRAYLDEHGFKHPMLVTADQVGMRVPPRSLTLDDIEQYIGGKQEIKAIDVVTQKEAKVPATVEEWMAYFRTPFKKRGRILNLLSLECGNTRMGGFVQPPQFVREVGWVQTLWPTKTKRDQQYKPRVQLYCLMSSRGSFTEFHIDFGGSSVWYNLYRGKKIFFVAPPTPYNLRKYEEWQRTYDFRTSQFFSDIVSDSSYVEVSQGQTFLIPSGWIHAVYTPRDSIAFGGNFLTNYHIPSQIAVDTMEQTLGIIKRFRFPQFETLLWYAAAHYAVGLMTDRTLTKWERESMDTLLDKLKAMQEEYKDVYENTKSNAQVTPDEFSPAKRVQMWYRACESAGFGSPEELMSTLERLYYGDRSNDQNYRCPRGYRPTLEVSAKQCQMISSMTSCHLSASSSSSSSSSAPSSSSESDSSSDSGGESGQDASAMRDRTAGGNDSSSDSSSSSSSSSSSGSSSDDDSDGGESAKDADDNADDGAESSSSDSESSEPESAYPELPETPVDRLISEHKKAKRRSMQLTSDMKAVILKRTEENQREHDKSKKRSKSTTPKSKKKTVKQEVALGPTDPSYAAPAVVEGVLPIEIPEADKDWVVECLCGIGGRNFDDGTPMVECEKCKRWLHVLCVEGKLGSRIPDMFVCHMCEWWFQCPCGIKQKNYEDFHRMVQCEMCEKWQHTYCVGIPDDVEAPDVYACPSCREKKASGKSTSKKQAPRRRRQVSPRPRTPKAKGPAPPTAPAAPAVPAPSVVIHPPPPRAARTSPPPPPPPPSSPPPPPTSKEPEPEHASARRGTRTPKHNHRRPRGESSDSSYSASPSQSQSRKRKLSNGSNGSSGARSTSSGIHSAISPPVSDLVRPPLPSTPILTGKSGLHHLPSTPGSAQGSKRKESARDRLEKKLKKRKTH